MKIFIRNLNLIIIFTLIVNCYSIPSHVPSKQVLKHFELQEDSNWEWVNSQYQHLIKVMKQGHLFQHHSVCIGVTPLQGYQIPPAKFRLYCEYLDVIIHYSRFMFLRVSVAFCYHPLIIYISMLFLKYFLCLICSFSFTPLILMMKFLFKFNQY